MTWQRFSRSSKPLVLVLSLVIYLLTATDAFVTTAPPTVTRTKPSPTVPPPIVESFIPKIVNGTKPIHVVAFAQIPDFMNKPSRIVGMTHWKNNLYVTTSTSGAFIYKVTSWGKVTLWLELQKIVNSNTGHNVDCVSSQHGGIRSVAFPPDYDTTGLFYVSYLEVRPKNKKGLKYLTPPFNNNNSPDSIVAELKFNHKIGKVNSGYFRYVLRISNLDNDHPIKQMAFNGRFLLIGHGDGSQGSFPKQGGMNNNALGKVLRIDPKKSGTKPYTIPWNNPFRGNPRYRNEIYAVGFRNPHNICVDKIHGTFVTDAGRDNVEEVNILKPGKNYGWQLREGTFVHLMRGGTLTGIRPLPPDDAKNKFTYPNVQVPHWAPKGNNIFGQALAGSCPINNGSPLQGLFLYANFAADGQLYYSYVKDMKSAVTEGPPKKLKQATIYVARRIFFDHDGNPATKPLKMENLRDVVINDGKPKASRVDLRFARAWKGAIYWSSKVTGKIYKITSSDPRAKV